MWLFCDEAATSPRFWKQAKRIFTIWGDHSMGCCCCIGVICCTLTETAVLTEPAFCTLSWSLSFLPVAIHFLWQGLEIQWLNSGCRLWLSNDCKHKRTSHMEIELIFIGLVYAWSISVVCLDGMGLVVLMKCFVCSLMHHSRNCWNDHHKVLSARTWEFKLLCYLI